MELVFDPLEMERVEVRFQGRSMGPAVPLVIRRDVHPRARAQPEPGPPAPTGIDYLGLIQARRRAEIEARIDYRALDGDQSPLGERDDDEGDHDEEDQ